MHSLIDKAGAITYLVEELGKADREKFCALLPQVRNQVAALLDDLWHFPPYSFLDKETEDEMLGTIFSEDALDQLMDGASEVRRFFFRYLTACFSIPLGIFHFGCACDYFVSHYLARLKRRKEDSFAVAAHDCFNSQDFWTEMEGLPLADIETFTVSPRLLSTYVFARNPRAEKELIFVSRSRFETAVLTVREQTLVRHYFGLGADTAGGMTLEGLAIRLNYNGPSGAQKALDGAIRKLREHFDSGEWSRWREAKRLIKDQ